MTGKNSLRAKFLTNPELIEGINQLHKSVELTRDSTAASPEDATLQTEAVRKMLLSMVKDIRVVLIQLALRNFGNYELSE